MDQYPEGTIRTLNSLGGQVLRWRPVRRVVDDVDDGLHTQECSPYHSIISS
jgi:hypothetical protein